MHNYDKKIILAFGFENMQYKTNGNYTDYKTRLIPNPNKDISIIQVNFEDQNLFNILPNHNGEEKYGTVSEPKIEQLKNHIQCQIKNITQDLKKNSVVKLQIVLSGHAPIASSEAMPYLMSNGTKKCLRFNPETITSMIKNRKK
jgi:hypothetical protein